MGAPSLPPGGYFRMRMIGYFEGIDSERGIVWRCSDLLSLRKRGEVVERSFAHVLERRGMRRTWLRGRQNVHKRYLVHVAGYNLGILMRALLGAGTPREMPTIGNAVVCVIHAADAIAIVVVRKSRRRIRRLRGRGR